MTDTARSDGDTVQDLVTLHQQLRLYRLAKELGVSSDLLVRLKPEAPHPAEALRQAEAPRPAEAKASEAAKAPEQAVVAAPVAKADVEMRADARSGAEAEQVSSLSVKQQIEQLALARGVADKAAQLASHTAWLAAHYHELEVMIRDRIISSFAAAKIPSYLTTVAVAERSELEHLAVYLHLRHGSHDDSSDQSLEQSLAYGLEHQNALLAALQKDSRRFDRSADALALEWAEAMLSRGWQKPGFAVLAIVPGTREGRDNPHYHEAIKLAARYRDEQSTAELTARLRNQYDPKLKRQQLSFWLKKANPKAGAPSPKALWLRGSLQPIFADLMTTFERHPTSLSQLAELLFSHRDALTVLPYLWASMVTASREFMSPTLTHALWRRFYLLPVTSSDPAVVRGVVAAAKLQMFLLDACRDEAAIWWAKDQLEQPEVVQAMGMRWSGLAGKWLASLDTPARRTIPDRDYLQAFIRMTLGEAITGNQFQRYLKLAKHPAQKSLTTVLGRTATQGKGGAQDEVMIAAYERLILVRSLTNGELADWLKRAQSARRFDLAWRIVSVLKFRGALTPSYDQAWPYSGENQNPPPLGGVQSAELHGFFDYHDLAQALLRGVVAAGPLLPAIFSPKNDTGQLPTSPLTLPQLAITREELIFDEKLVSMLLDRLPKGAQPFQSPTLIPPAREARTARGEELDPRSRQWLITYHRLAQFYGIHQLGFSLEGLTRLEDQLVAQSCFSKGAELGSGSPKGSSARSAQRYFALESSRRQQLRQLLSLGKAFKGSEGGEWAQRMLILLSFIHYPSHYYGLRVLEEINCPLPVMRWAESMILTKGYSALRRQQGRLSQIPFPSSLKNKPIIQAG